jgi:TRAP-type C4-dicarboxylate transport system substrate-binding protein
VLLEIYKKYKPESFAKVKVLTMFTTAPSNIMSKKPVRSLADIKGMDLRASGGAAQILKTWGANQVGMPMSATPEALQKGVVQGLFSSVEVMKDFKFAELCKYMTMTDTVIYPFAVVMNMDKWNALPKDVQKVFDDLIEEQALWTGTYMDNHAKESIEWSKKEQGVEVITLPKEELATWNAMLGGIVEDWIKEADKNNISGKALVDDITSIVKAASAKAK